jgi:hypothetical protein
MKLPASVITLTRLAEQLADRFEKVGLGEDGALDPDDKKLLTKVRSQVEKVRTEPLRKLMEGQ